MKGGKYFKFLGKFIWTNQAYGTIFIVNLHAPGSGRATTGDGLSK
jgi:hypothetical protein